MKRSVLVLLMVLVPGICLAQNIGGSPFIAVHGEAKVRVVPDVFPVAITLSEKGMDTAAMQERIEALASDILDEIKAFDLKDADVIVGNLDISPQFDYDQETQQQVFLGNQYERNIAVRFHSLTDLKEFLSKIPTGKEIRVETLNFELSNIAEAKRKLMLAAIGNAKATAEMIARGIDKKILGIQTISDRPLNLSMGSYINPIDISSVESTDILTAEQVRQIDRRLGVNGTSVALLAPGSSSSPSIILTQGAITLTSNAYVIYLLGD